MTTLSGIGRQVYGCPDCHLVPSDYHYADGRTPFLDGLFDAGREWYTLPYGSMTMGGLTFPINADFIPCNKHLAMLKEQEAQQ